MGNTYHVDSPGGRANLQNFLHQPQTPELLLKVERVVQQYVWREWATSDSNVATSAIDTGNTADIWLTWNSSSASTGTVSLNIADPGAQAWGGWNVQTSASTTDDTWSGWNTNPSNVRVFQRQYQQQWPTRQETVEERDARVQRELQLRQQREERRVQQTAELKAARTEAKALLDSLLSEIQRQSLEEEGWFIVIGKSGKIYRLRKGRVGNIDQLDEEGRVVTTLCSHPGPYLPNADDLVAQKMFLETDDEYVRQNANVRRPFVDGKVIDMTKYLPKVA